MNALETIVDDAIVELAPRGIEPWQRRSIVDRAERACRARAAIYGLRGLSLTTTRKIARSVTAIAIRDLRDGKLLRAVDAQEGV